MTPIHFRGNTMKLNTIALRVFALVATLFAVIAGHAEASGVVLAYSVITNSSVNTLWRKAQGKLKPGFNFVTKEFGWVKDLKELEIDASLREMTFPVDLYEDRGVTSLPEGGRQAEPMTVNAVDATVSFVHVNARFTVSKLARWAQMTDPSAAIQKQLQWEGKKKVEALGRVISDMFYGYSTNYLAQVDDAGAALSSGASHTITLKNGLGDSAIPGTTTAQKNYIADRIKVGDRVALIASAALVTNAAFGTVTAVTPGTPSIGVTWVNGNVDPDDGDYLVFSNGATGTTIEHTSYNRGLVGLRDICTSTSVHGISKSVVPNWDVAYADTNAGRFNGTKWRTALDKIHDDGDENANPMTVMSKGVRRDLASQYAAGVRFDDSMDLEIDGEPKARGKKMKGTKRVPPGMVFVFDGEKALRRKSIHEAGRKAPNWNDGYELQDDSGWIFGVEESLFMAVTNRKCFAYFEGQTEA